MNLEKSDNLFKTYLHSPSFYAIPECGLLGRQDINRIVLYLCRIANGSQGKYDNVTVADSFAIKICIKPLISGGGWWNYCEYDAKIIYFLSSSRILIEL